jgi:hypothetical protein
MRAHPRASCEKISVFATTIKSLEKTFHEKAFYGRKWILQIPGSPVFFAVNFLFCNEQNSTSNRMKIAWRGMRQLFACLI